MANKSAASELWETLKVIVQALAIAFFVRTFLFQPFNIPSPSMYPTLRTGDYLFVSKLSYGYGKYSFNFQGFNSGNKISEKDILCCNFIDFPGRKFALGEIQRGDVAVFKFPPNRAIDYIKRIIGLPGDQIQMKDGVLFINGLEVKKERVEDFVDLSVENGRGSVVPQYKETLPNGVTYNVLDAGNYPDADNTEIFTVPPNNYFAMGDNRDNSSDSRFKDAVGLVPIENFVGKANIIFFSFKPEASLLKPWEWPFLIRWSRFFNWVS